MHKKRHQQKIKLFVIHIFCFQKKPLYSHHHLEAWLVSVLLFKHGLSLVAKPLFPVIHCTDSAAG